MEDMIQTHDIDEIMTRQWLVDASTITRARWRWLSHMQRAYCVLNHVGEFPDDLRDAVDVVRYMITPWQEDFLTVDREDEGSVSAL